MLRARSRNRRKSAKPAILNFLAALCIAVSILASAGLFFEKQDLFALRVLAGVVFATALLDAGAALHRWYKHRLEKPVVHPKQLILPGVALLIGCCAWGFTAFLRGVPGGADAACPVAWPVRAGAWKVVTGGRSSLTNYHHNNPPAQNYAVDVVRSSGTTAGEVVYAPVGGVITQAVNDRTAGKRRAGR